jgi:hypothetical protein
MRAASWQAGLVSDDELPASAAALVRGALQSSPSAVLLRPQNAKLARELRAD